MTDEERQRRKAALTGVASDIGRGAKSKAERRRKPKSANGEPLAPPPIVEERRTNGLGVDWKEEALKTERGAVMAIYANAVLALESHPDFVGLLGFDDFRNRATVLRKLPNDPPGFVAPRPLGDIDVLLIQGMLQWRGLPRISRQTTGDAVDAVAQNHRFHPIRDWLNGLQWDGEPRLAVWLTKAAGSPDDEYHRQVGTLFLTAMVARIMRPGCQADYVPVLEGDQGIMKSSLCRELAGGEEYFSDHLPSLRTDDVRMSMHLRGLWLAEVSELASFRRGEVEELKSFLTRREEKYTPKYGRRQVVEPRQCLFVATTNRKDYNRDETGARRIWPVSCGTIELGWLREHREQLFAEAVERFKQGKPWWPDRDDEAKYFLEQQKDRYEEDAWTKTVEDYLASRDQVTVLGVAEEALGLLKRDVGTAVQRRITAILAIANWHHGRRAGNSRWWERKPAN